jgi:hypothetical protein
MRLHGRGFRSTHRGADKRRPTRLSPSPVTVVCASVLTPERETLQCLCSASTRHNACCVALCPSTGNVENQPVVQRFVAMNQHKAQEDTKACGASTSWGSLVRAQYRPFEKARKAGLFVLCPAPVVRRGRFVGKLIVPRAAGPSKERSCRLAISSRLAGQRSVVSRSTQHLR